MANSQALPHDDAVPAAQASSLPERLRFLLRYAVLAPSGHNTQPWSFHVDARSIELRADRSRSLPVVDPHDRELTISCGAALYNLEVAARAFGLQPDVATLPEPSDPDLLARIQFLDGHEPTDADRGELEAIPRRRTDRGRYAPREVDGRTLDALRSAVRSEGAWLEVLEASSRDRAAALIAEGDRVQMADPRFRRELAAWVHPNRTRRADGMPGYAFGVGDLPSLVGPLVIRAFDLGKGQAKKDRALVAGSPVLAVLGTGDDAPADWLRAGRALERMLLRATQDGLAVSYMNQPVELPTLRERLASLTSEPGHPQLLLRMGYGPGTRPTPRRPVDEVMEVPQKGPAS